MFENKNSFYILHDILFIRNSGNKMTQYKTQKFPYTRIATIDVCNIGKKKNHIPALLELDVSKIRENIRTFNKQNPDKISFTGMMISLISKAVKKFETSSSFIKGKNRLIIFEDVNVSIIVEKEINGEKVPIPLVIEKAHEKNAAAISMEITNAKNKQLNDEEIVLQKKASRLEKLYYKFPGFVRRYVWRYLLKHPTLVYNKMGNVAFTSIGMMGKVNGWFIPISIHPVCFGASSVMKKPLVIDNKIEIREILNLTVLLDHDVIDGADMARLISYLAKNIENG